jgi:hypothetical protein
MHIAAKQFLNKAVKLRQDCVAIGQGVVHTVNRSIVPFALNLNTYGVTVAIQ